MKKAALMFLLLATVVGFGFAQTAEERQTAMEGVLVMVQGSDGQAMIMLRLSNGDLVAIELPKGEAERLKLRERDRLRIEGVFIGSTSQSGLQARILARTMTRAGRVLKVENPIQLTERDRLQIRAYEEEQLMLQTQTRTQTQDQTRTGSPSGEGSGTPSTGKK
jgi:hypothetical protein